MEITKDRVIIVVISEIKSLVLKLTVANSPFSIQLAMAMAMTNNGIIDEINAVYVAESLVKFKPSDFKFTSGQFLI